MKTLAKLEDSELIASYGHSTKGSNYIQVGNREFLNFHPNHTVRSDYARSDYDSFRSGEAVPKDINQLIGMCSDVADRVGVVNHVINLMADFACKGISLVHPVKSQEKFYKRWFEKVGGKDRSERFLNMLYKCGNTVIQKSMGELTTQQITDFKAEGAKSISIPLSYTIHNPLSLEVVGGELASFFDKPYYLLKVDAKIVNGARNLLREGKGIPKDILNKLNEALPPELKLGKKTTTNGAYIVLQQDDLYPFHYKKDDDETWAKPMIHCILEDVLQLSKMKLADNSALDGVLSQVRLWNLGIYNPTNPAASILPTRAGIDKLRNILSNVGSGGVLDVVWGPELTFKESATNTHQFLGDVKYKPVWHAIYEGLGIPPTLTGAGGKDGGSTNNSLSLRTLIDRLEYGRNLLLEFWNEQIRIVQKAMGFAKPAQVSFDLMSLSDESSIKNLLIQLVDRDIISNEAVQRSFGFVPESENARIKRETKKRNSGIMPPKASAYHNPQTEEELKKIALQGGSVAPSEVGLELEEKKKGEETSIEKQARLKPDKQFAPPKSKNGRPKNSNDTQKRKVKVVKTKGLIQDLMWAESAQGQIADIVTPLITSALGKKNIRQLSNDETQSLEEIKFAILCSVVPYEPITEELVYIKIEEKTPDWALNSLAELKTDFIDIHKRQPNINEVRQLQSSVIALREEDNG